VTGATCARPPAREEEDNGPSAEISCSWRRHHERGCLRDDEFRFHLEGARGAKNEAARRAAEDALARELTARGAQGVAGYAVVPVNVTDEAEAKALVEKSGAEGVVVMRPVGKVKEIYSTPTMYTGPSYGRLWGGYYGYGWGGAWGATEVRTNTIVSVETLVYSLAQNKLIWAGQSKTTNPSKVDSFVREVVQEAAKEMKKEGLL
jgi:hypothetical protein